MKIYENYFFTQPKNESKVSKQDFIKLSFI
jgi:hypothetical protein